jgi:hypothetical protein
MVSRVLKKTSAQVPIEVYLNRPKIAEMAYKEEAKFIRLLKDFKIRDLTRFVGYEADPPILLASGNKPRTLQWNPFVFALVLGRTELFNFIAKNVDFNLTRLLEFDSYTNEGEYLPSEGREPSMTVFQLMIENNSFSLLKSLLNDMSYLFHTNHVKRLIGIITKSSSAR